jgi:mannonate dehydratase
MFIHSWRGFGPGDRVRLDQVIQTGAVNIVTALHQVPVGETWSSEEIRKRRALIEQAGLKWLVVESVPVHEDIKKGSGRFREYIENYRQTLVNLGKEGLTTVCYNFMPALDWSRTNLAIHNADDSESSGFNAIHFAAIDLFILKRPGASQSYPEEVSVEAESYFASLDGRDREALKNTFLLGFPGSGESFSLKEVLKRIEEYRGMDRADIHANLKQFLEEVVPVAESSGIRLAIHPDDPPWSLLGMPRAVSTLEDAQEILSAVDSGFNGITFCTGSFGAAHFNDLPRMAEKLARRVNFLHIRNVQRDEKLNFREENLLSGDVDIPAIMKTMVLEDMRRSETIPGYSGIPVRPDHGARILGDYQEEYYPGYSLYGRMKNLAEIRGLEMGIRSSLGVDR